jgi:hypothetical protein
VLFLRRRVEKLFDQLLQTSYLFNVTAVAQVILVLFNRVQLSLLHSVVSVQEAYDFLSEEGLKLSERLIFLVNYFRSTIERSLLVMVC